MMKLSHMLLDLGFFSVLGTSEHPAMCEEGYRVKRGEPNTSNYNNGVFVVYDEVGRPWILHGCNMTDTVREALNPYLLSQRGYVPHSNDGGYFVREVLPKL